MIGSCLHKILWGATFAGCLVFFSCILTVGVLIPQLIVKDGAAALEIGMFISLVNALFGLSSQLQETIPDYINTFRYQFEYLKDLNDFLSFETDKDATCLPAVQSEKLETIEFCHISFRYPNCEQYILQDSV